MQRTISKYTPQCAISSPVPAWLDGDFSRDVVFVVVNVQPKGAADVILYQLTKACFAV